MYNVHITINKDVVHRGVLHMKKQGGHKSGFKRLLSCLVVSVIAVLLFSTAAVAGQDKLAMISLEIQSVSMIQGEEIPAVKAVVKCEGETDEVIDSTNKYTVQNLLDDLNKGTGYTISCSADGVSEGEFPATIKLDGSLEESILNEWAGKVQIDVKNGSLTVQNKYGTWDGDTKFKRLDGSQVVGDFIVSKGNTYYFNADGIKGTAWQDINNYKYYFDKAGVMQTGWLDFEKNKYYLSDTGVMTIGWLTLDDVKYYFDREGKMVTGEQKIGSSKCVFSKEGKLESQTSSIDPTKPMIALTFDDGPGPRTNEILATLEQYQAHATFFMLGSKISNYPDVIKKMDSIGCELGNHSRTHTSLTKLGTAGIQEEIGGTNSEINAIIGKGATVMRPPYGAINDTVKASVGMPMIMWSIDTLDWKTRNVDSTINSVMNTAKDGDIVLMHDIHTQSVDAAIAVIPKLIDAGYQLVTVTELAEARGTTLENGGKYSEFRP